MTETFEAFIHCKVNKMKLLKKLKMDKVETFKDPNLGNIHTINAFVLLHFSNYPFVMSFRKLVLDQYLREVSGNISTSAVWDLLVHL